MLQRSVEFTIPGEPYGKPSVRTTKNGFTYMDRKATAYWDMMVKEFRKQCPDVIRWERRVPLRLTIRAYYGIRESASKKEKQAMLEQRIRPTKTPDWDNIGKMVCDGLNGIAWYDDAQIVHGETIKRYSTDPRVEITITEVSEE